MEGYPFLWKVLYSRFFEEGIRKKPFKDV